MSENKDELPKCPLCGNPVAYTEAIVWLYPPGSRFPCSHHQMCVQITLAEHKQLLDEAGKDAMAQAAQVAPAPTPVAPTLIEHLDGKKCQSFTPGVRYNRHGDHFEVYWADAFSYLDASRAGVSLYRSIATDEVTGCKISGFTVRANMDAVVLQADGREAAPTEVAQVTADAVYHVRKRYSNGCEACPEIWRGREWVATVTGTGSEAIQKAQAMCDALNAHEAMRQTLERIAGLVIVAESHADCGNVAMHAIRLAREALEGKP